MSERKIFLAGASGAVGRTIVRLAAGDPALVPHYRRAPSSPIVGAAVFGLEDTARLVEGLRGVTTVVQCIGTMRKRFAAGDTYETSDIGTTAQLLDSAREVGSVDHVVLLSSVGAGRPMGAYLKAKAKVEAMVTASGIPYTIFRPSAFDGEGHKAPPGMALLTRIPGLGVYRPIRVEALAGAILRVARTREPLGVVLEGDALFALTAA
jgi:uncharacterized protein YbjT (DUF2867 family)